MEAENTLVTRGALKRMSDCQTFDCNSQVSREGAIKLENRQCIQALGPQGVPGASNQFACKSILIHGQRPSGGVTTASQVKHVRWHITTGISMQQQQQQQPWVPPNVSGKWQNKDFPPAATRARPPARRAGERGAEHEGVGASQHNGKRSHAQDRPSQRTQEEKLSPRLSRRNQMSQKKGIPSLPVQSLCNTVAQKAMRLLEKVKEQWGHKLGAADDTCPNSPSAPQINAGKNQHKKELQIQVGRAQGLHLHHQPSCPHSAKCEFLQPSCGLHWRHEIGGSQRLSPRKVCLSRRSSEAWVGLPVPNRE